MEKLKRYIFLFLAALALSSCAEFDASKIWDELKDHEGRISALETLCKDLNTNMASLVDILSALEVNDYVTGTTTLTEGGAVIGYVIHFSKSGSVTIYHGNDGDDAESPNVSIRKANDGN